MKKRIFSAILAILMLVSVCGFTAAAVDEVTVLSCIKEKSSNIYTVTFSKPVHFYKNGYVWLRQNNPEDGNGQINPTSIEYVGEDKTSSGGADFSSVVRFTFGAYSKEKYGISIVEYYLNDTNAGYVSPEVVKGVNGELLKATFKSNQNLDFCFIPNDACDTENKYSVHIKESSGVNYNPATEVALLSCEFISDTELWITFSEPVKIVGNVWASIRYCTVSASGVPALKILSKVNPNDTPLQTCGKTVTSLPSDSATYKFTGSGFTDAFGGKSFGTDGNDCTVYFSIEGKPDGFSKDSYTYKPGYIDNIQSLDGKRLLKCTPGKEDKTNGIYDGVYILPEKSGTERILSAQIDYSTKTVSVSTSAEIKNVDITKVFLKDTTNGEIKYQAKSFTKSGKTATFTFENVISGAMGLYLEKDALSCESSAFEENCGFDIWIPNGVWVDANKKYGVILSSKMSIVSATLEPSTHSVKFVFTEPTHIFNKGYIWLCTNPEPAGGTDQHGVSSVSYGTEQVKDAKGNVYSTEVTINFSKADFVTKQADTSKYPSGYTVPVESVGVRFVEYNMTEYLKDGLVAYSVLHSINGSSLEANYSHNSGKGDVDINWVPTDGWFTLPINLQNKDRFASALHIKIASPELTGVSVLDKNTVSLTFSASVKALGILPTVKVGQNTYTAKSAKADSEYSIGFILSFDEDITAAESITVTPEMFEAAGERKLEDKYRNLPISDDDKFKPFTLEAGAKYSFMNADTGRTITVDGEDEFTLISDANGYSFKKGDKFVDFAKSSLSDTAVYFRISLTNPYERLQIFTPDWKKLLADDDKGSDGKASVTLYDAGNLGIETGWFATKEGEKRPVKFAVVGDSITCGVIPDDSNTRKNKPGFREELSAKLIEEYGRVVFVGTLKHAAGSNTTAINNTTVNDGFLYRHEGHSGWVIHNDPEKNPSADDNNRGIDDDGVYKLYSGATEERHIRRTLQEKYAPDVIFMMIGINDVGMNGYSVSANEKILAKWNTLADHILAELPEDGHLIVGTLTPRTNSTGWNTSNNNTLEAYNELLKAEIANRNKAGETRVSVADNYTAMKDAGTSALSTDTIHPSTAGYTALAESYFKAYDELPKDTEEADGDIDGNGEFTPDDAIYLLYAFYFPESYKVNGNADVDGSGTFTPDDAIYLLYAFYFPESYKLY